MAMKQEVALGSSPMIALRPFELSDLDEAIVWLSEEHVTHFFNWGPFDSKDDLHSSMKGTLAPEGSWLRMICVEGQTVGAIVVMPPQTGYGSCKVEIAYVLASGHWGKGIATAAVKAAVGEVFGVMEGVERVEAFVDIENPASQRVLEKAGFKREGVLRKYKLLNGKPRDMVIFSFVQD